MPLCVCGFAWLSRASVPVFHSLRLVVRAGGLSTCVRIRGLCLSTCLGWVSVGHVCALGPGLSRLPAPLLSTVSPYLASNFSPGSSSNACWQPSSLSPPEVLQAARGRDRIGGSGVIPVPGDWPGPGLGGACWTPSQDPRGRREGRAWSGLRPEAGDSGVARCWQLPAFRFWDRVWTEKPASLVERLVWF